MTASMLHVRVAAKTPLAEGICAFELRAADGPELPPFTAGAHLDVLMPGGLTRQYSLCNSPAERHRYLIAVLREPASRGGSATMHERVQVGDTLTVSAPKNHFPLVALPVTAPAASGAAGAAPGARSLLLAGGIGVTPTLAMAEALGTQGADFEFHYCTRSLARTAFLDRIRAAPWGGRLRLHLDDGPAAQRLDPKALLGTPQPGTHLYVCGPRGFMDAVLGAARAAGWPEAQLHWEFFAGEAAPAAGDSAFEVQLAKSGRIVVVPAGQTAVRALEAAGVSVPTSCEQGVCGTCITRVLEGVPDHRDSYFTPEEQAANDQFTPCCSRARTPRLVIDL
ncbi:MAG: oxidoreductase [Burkholderiales bacterium]|nr:oxidoreductase [Burkholderiales bacterium]